MDILSTFMLQISSRTNTNPHFRCSGIVQTETVTAGNLTACRCYHAPVCCALSYRWVDVSVLTVAPADVHLVLCCLLIDGVFKVDGVGVLQSPVPPQQHGAKHSQTQRN